MKNNKLRLFAFILVLLLSLKLPLQAQNRLSTTKYQVTDKNGNIVGNSDTLHSAMNLINQRSGEQFTITVFDNDEGSGSFPVGVQGNKRVTIRSDSSNTYTIKSTQVSDTKNSYYMISVYGNLILENIILDGQGKSSGLQVYGGKLTLNSGTVLQNFYDILNPGAAVRLYSTGSEMIMNDGAIIRNNISTLNGGGVAISHGNTFTMNGGLITSNETLTRGGAGVTVNGTFIMNDGEISYNKALETSKGAGGGVAVGVRGNFIANGGIIRYNEAQFGGGIYTSPTEEVQNIVLSNLKITDNKAYIRGGGLVVAGNPITINDTIFSGNTVINQDGQGGAIASYASISINNTTFLNNSADQGGALYTNDSSSIVSTITRSVFSDNVGKWGGGILIRNNLVEVIDSSLENNSAQSSGGGIYVYDGNVTVKGSSHFFNNSAVYYGGAIYTLNYSYENPALSDSYLNVITESSISFKNNHANAGLFNPPQNANNFTNLKFSQTSISTLSPQNDSLLNNYDINYFNDARTLTYVTIQYHPNNGSESIFKDRVLTNQDYIILDATNPFFTFEKAGHHFVGWNTGEDGEGNNYLKDSVITTTNNLLLYAQWQANQYNINYILGGGQNDEGNPSHYTYGLGVNKFMPARKEGAIFLGWYDHPFEGNLISNISSSQMGPINLYARWQFNDNELDNVVPPTGAKSTYDPYLLMIPITFIICGIILKKQAHR